LYTTVEGPGKNLVTGEAVVVLRCRFSIVTVVELVLRELKLDPSSLVDGAVEDELTMGVVDSYEYDELSLVFDELVEFSEIVTAVTLTVVTGVGVTVV
jgi:hypothetical protein